MWNVTQAQVRESGECVFMCCNMCARVYLFTTIFQSNMSYYFAKLAHLYSVLIKYTKLDCLFGSWSV